MSAENEIRKIKLFEEEIRNIKQMAFDAAHPVNETYTQYPQQDDPMTLYNKDGVTSVWEIQSQYSGAFFRSSNAPEAVYKADDEDEYYIRDTVTGALLPINASASGGPSISPTSSGSSIVIEGKEYKRYPVTASSRNAADYINKTNSLNVQTCQNLYHNHGGTTGDDSPDHSHTINHGHTAQAYYASSGGSTGFEWHSSGGASGSSPLGRVEVSYHYGSSGGASARHQHSISNDGGNEARPNNFTQIIWKRIS